MPIDKTIAANPDLMPFLETESSRDTNPGSTDERDKCEARPARRDEQHAMEAAIHPFADKRAGHANRHSEHNLFAFAIGAWVLRNREAEGEADSEPDESSIPVRVVLLNPTDALLGEEHLTLTTLIQLQLIAECGDLP